MRFFAPGFGYICLAGLLFCALVAASAPAWSVGTQPESGYEISEMQRAYVLANARAGCAPVLEKGAITAVAFTPDEARRAQVLAATGLAFSLKQALGNGQLPATGLGHTPLDTTPAAFTAEEKRALVITAYRQCVKQKTLRGIAAERALGERLYALAGSS